MRLYAPEQATFGTMRGPFYPDALETLAALIAAIRPQGSVDLDLYWHQLTDGIRLNSPWGIDYLGDGYVPWRGFRLIAEDEGIVWLVLPQLRETEGGAMVFERCPSLYVERGDLSEARLGEIAASLVEAFKRPLVA